MILLVQLVGPRLLSMNPVPLSEWGNEQTEQDQGEDGREKAIFRTAGQGWSPVQQAGERGAEHLGEQHGRDWGQGAEEKRWTVMHAPGGKTKHQKGRSHQENKGRAAVGFTADAEPHQRQVEYGCKADQHCHNLPGVGCGPHWAPTAPRWARSCARSGTRAHGTLRSSLRGSCTRRAQAGACHSTTLFHSGNVPQVQGVSPLSSR